MLVRPIARAVVLDPAGRVLLFYCRADEAAAPRRPRAWWIAPGGGVEAGETFEDAARRELWEETGIAVAAVGPCLLEEEDVGRHPDFGQQDVLLRRRYFLVRLSAAELARLSPEAMARAGHQGHRWWPLEELERCEEPVYPDGLPTLIRSRLAVE